jgi:hypothetical protein
MTDDQDLCQECGGPMPAAASTGRPRRNCSDACRKRAFRRGRARVATLLASVSTTLDVEPVHAAREAPSTAPASDFWGFYA